MIDWQEDVTEPPLTTHLPEQEIQENIVNKTMFSMKEYPCHTQFVERMIKLVTESSTKVIGSTNRDGFVHNKLASFKKMKYFHTKKDYVP